MAEALAQPATGEAIGAARARLVIAASSLGTVFEWYDFFIYGTLAPIIGKLFFPASSETAQFLLVLATFGIGFGMRLQVICRENEADAWEVADQLVRHATERQKQEMKTLYNRSEANQRVQQLARDYGDLLMPHLWTGITKVRPGAGIAVVGNPEQCAATLQQFIDAGCHSFCLSGYLHDEEAERFGRLIRPILAANNRGRLAA